MRRDDPKKSPSRRPRTYSARTSRTLNQFAHIPLRATSNRIRLTSRKVMRLAEPAEESSDTAVGEPEPGEIRVNGF
jgi:hypothetical protein